MTLTHRQADVKKSIIAWEEKYKEYNPTDFERLYDKWLERGLEKVPMKLRTKFFNRLDTVLFHLHAMIQGMQLQIDARQRILTNAQIFDAEISRIEDMQNLSIEQLTYIAEQQIAKHRVYSFTQGGASAAGGLLFLGLDIPALTAMNLRAVQLIAMTYGYDVNSPREMMTSLKVFHAATLPKRLQYAGWYQLKDDLEKSEHSFWYEGNEDLTDETWLEQPLKQILKVMFLSLFRKKLIQGIPLAGMVFGAGLNYQLSRQVTDYAHRFYQMRYLADKYDETFES